MVACQAREGKQAVQKTPRRAGVFSVLQEISLLSNRGDARYSERQLPARQGEMGSAVSVQGRGDLRYPLNDIPSIKNHEMRFGFVLPTSVSQMWAAEPPRPVSGMLTGMNNAKEQGPMDRRRMLRKTDRLTRPPRLEGKVKNAAMNPVRKRKKSR